MIKRIYTDPLAVQLLHEVFLCLVFFTLEKLLIVVHIRKIYILRRSDRCAETVYLGYRFYIHTQTHYIETCRKIKLVKES